MSESRQTTLKRLPGEVGLWVFIVTDLSLFCLYFALLAYDRSVDPEAFYAGQAQLDRSIGLVNTLLLLTGSWAVAMGTRVVREPQRAAAFLSRAAVTGILFLLLKTVEYSHLVGAGNSLTDSRYFTWYFFLTGYHALHVLVGIVLLYFVAARFRSREPVSEALTEAAGCYWHLVDLLWIGIFTLAYLI